jgi:hypothetical protein
LTTDTPTQWKPARHLVAVVVELAAGVQNREHHLGGRLAALVAIDGNAAPVVDHRHRVVDVNRDVDLVAESGERLVDRVVDDLVDEMMESRCASRPDVHGRPLLHGLQALEHLDLVRTVIVGGAVAVRARGGLGIGRQDGAGLRLLFGMCHVFLNLLLACVEDPSARPW